jgi:hypothetical protein
MPAEVEARACELRRTHPRWGPHRLVHELRRLNITPVPSRSTCIECWSDAGLDRYEFKRLVLPGRCVGVMMVTSPLGGWVFFAGLHAWSWPLACLAVGALLGLVVIRLLVEAQRRRTLLELVERAPIGTVVVVEQTSELPAMWVWIGHDVRQLPPRGPSDTPHP